MLSMSLVLSSVQSNTYFSNKMWSEWICKLHSGCRPSTSPSVRHLQCSHSSLRPFVLAQSLCFGLLFPFTSTLSGYSNCVSVQTQLASWLHMGAPGIGTTEKTEANLSPGLLCPSCLAALVTQDIKALWYCRSQLWEDRGQRWCMCPTTQTDFCKLSSQCH